MKKYLVLAVFFLTNFAFADDLVPGDGVRLTFYNISQEISGDYFIHRDGNIQFPYIGLINTKNKDYEKIKSEIEAKYDSLYRGVELLIVPLYRISVLGEVGNPGVYYATGVEKILDVIALAGGETENSDMSEIYVHRKNEKLIFNAEKIIEEDEDIEDFYLESGDKVYVTRKWWVTGQNTAFLFSAASLVITAVAIFIR